MQVLVFSQVRVFALKQKEGELSLVPDELAGHARLCERAICSRSETLDSLFLYSPLALTIGAKSAKIRRIRDSLQMRDYTSCRAFDSGNGEIKTKPQPIVAC
jgi:hypothetical protein